MRKRWQCACSKTGSLRIIIKTYFYILTQKAFIFNNAIRINSFNTAIIAYHSQPPYENGWCEPISVSVIPCVVSVGWHPSFLTMVIHLSLSSFNVVLEFGVFLLWQPTATHTCILMRFGSHFSALKLLISLVGCVKAMCAWLPKWQPAPHVLRHYKGSMKKKTKMTSLFLSRILFVSDN